MTHNLKVVIKREQSIGAAGGSRSGRSDPWLSSMKLLLKLTRRMANGPFEVHLVSYIECDVMKPTCPT